MLRFAEGKDRGVEQRIQPKRRAKNNCWKQFSFSSSPGAQGDRATVMRGGEGRRGGGRSVEELIAGRKLLLRCELRDNI